MYQHNRKVISLLRIFVLICLQLIIKVTGGVIGLFILLVYLWAG